MFEVEISDGLLAEGVQAFQRLFSGVVLHFLRKVGEGHRAFFNPENGFHAIEVSAVRDRISRSVS